MIATKPSSSKIQLTSSSQIKQTPPPPPLTLMASPPPDSPPLLTSPSSSSPNPPSTLLITPVSGEKTLLALRSFTLTSNLTSLGNKSALVVTRPLMNRSRVESGRAYPNRLRWSFWSQKRRYKDSGKRMDRRRDTKRANVQVDRLSSLAHDKEGTRADVSASDWSVNDWSAFEGTKMLPADQSGADTSALVSPYHEKIAEMRTKSAQKRMDNMRVRLEWEIANIESNMSPMNRRKTLTESEKEIMLEQHSAELEYLTHIEETVTCIDTSWEDLNSQIERGKSRISWIISDLHNIKEVLIKLPASNRAELQPCFSSLCSEANIVVKKIMDYVKNLCDMKESRFSVYINGLATTSLQSF
ncbi:hypothetical protein Tco_0777223 [Tanacetum coccineum]